MNKENIIHKPNTDETKSTSESSIYVKRKPLLDLFPPTTPYSNGYLEVDSTHNLYWEQSGNPDGVPILLLHGGPGAGASPIHRRFFDPDFFRIIIFDQRGAGRSTPVGSLENNTTEHLIADIETLRKQLRVKKWHIFGGSWGSTLALSYAIKYKDHILSMILRGIFLCEQDEIDWFLYGMQNIFPEAWEQFSSIVSEDQRDNILSCYYKILTNDEDKESQMDAAVRWNLYEGACSSLIPNYDTVTTDEQKLYALALAKIEAHYFKTQVFSKEKSILNHIENLRFIPTTIIQGRYDIICPIKTAHKLHQLWPEADYVVVPDGGHSALDAPIRSRLIEATESLKTMQDE